MEFKEVFPDPETLLRLQPEEVGALLLSYLVRLREFRVNRYNIIGRGSFRLAGYAESQTETIKAVADILSEGWAWLEREGLVAPDPDQTGRDSVFVTRRGEQLAAQTDPGTYLRGQLLPAQRLDPVLAEKVSHLFLRGDYDSAVFQAFKEVEVRVRKAAGMPNTSLGTQLMFDAFKLPDGPLCAVAQPKSEQEAMRNLFAGAVGLFKNPSSHRDVEIEAHEASELIQFANYLLRLVDSALAAKNA